MDEVRLCPSNAFMSTYTFLPFVGISSTSDANNKITYYEYDGSNRLALVRDFDGNVLKKICYNYLGQPEYCKAIEGPSWSLSGQTRCKACDANENYITNILQREFIDVNPQSPSYGLARWEDIPGTNSSCVSPADWQNTNELRCVGYPETPGQQEQEQKDINPCSATAGNTRWILAGINLLECPTVVTQCNATNCSGNDKKCINDICRTGQKIYTSAVYRKGKWYCTYIYYWAEDGSSSINYSEESTTPCAVS